MRRLYQVLSLPGFVATEPALRRYVSDQASYRKNSFTLSADERLRVVRCCEFAFAELGYDSETPVMAATNSPLDLLQVRL